MAKRLPRGKPPSQRGNRPTPDRRHILPPDEYFAMTCRSVAEGARRTTREIFSEGRTLEQALEVGWGAGNFAEESIANFAEATGGKPSLACGKGCSYCCHIRVEAQIPEVVLIASYLKTKLSPEDLAATQARIAEYRASTEGFTGKDWFTCRLACPMLVDGECSIYPVRPLPCRGWNSMDVGPCKEYHDNPEARGVVPTYAPQWTITSHVADGMERGAKSHGLESYVVELSHALQIALGESDAIDRWLAGETVFEAAHRDMETDDFRKAQQEAQEINRRANAQPLVQIRGT